MIRLWCWLKYGHEMVRFYITSRTYHWRCRCGLYYQ